MEKTGSFARKQLPDSYCIVLVAAALLVPFLAKPFHVDDPLFIYAAKWILAHPLDFYGFDINWYGIKKPMADVMKNPPLASFYLAATAGPFGFREWAVHLALLFPTIGTALGFYRLSKRFCDNPLFSALIAVLTPVFLVSATTAMCDVMMLGFWVFAAERWIVGVDSGTWQTVILASLLGTLAVLSKYSGLCVFPLLWLYTIAHRRSFRWIAIGSVVPIIVLSLYQWGTSRLYGHGLLFDGAEYALSIRFESGNMVLSKTLTTLSFIGGCLLPMFFFSPLYASWRTLVISIVGLGLVAFICARTGPLHLFLFTPQGALRWLMLIQLSIFVLVGIQAFWLVVRELARRKPGSLFLAAWVSGIFIFTCFFNWSVNGRTLLPMAPAMAIVLTRRLESVPRLFQPGKTAPVAIALLLAGLTSLAIAAADFAQATSARVAATQIMEKYRPLASDVFFQGHWGFQYYMEELGGKPMDMRPGAFVPGRALVVMPLDNTNAHLINPDQYEFLEATAFPVSYGIRTLDLRVDAGFYTDLFGPLPFSFGPGDPARYLVLREK